MLKIGMEAVQIVFSKHRRRRFDGTDGRLRMRLIRFGDRDALERARQHALRAEPSVSGSRSAPARPGEVGKSLDQELGVGRADVCA